MSEEKNIFEKNMEMWEKWTGTYMDTMAKAMDKTMEQSASLKKQVDKAVATAIGTQFDAALGAIKARVKGGLNALEQVEALSGKIDELIEQED